MVKAILFDCFGVLVTDAWLPFKARHFGHDPALYEEASDISQQANLGVISHDDFVNKIAGLSGKSFKEVERVMSSNVPNEPLFDYIRELKKTYKIGFLSNIAADYLNRMFTPEQLGLFDATSLSFENGYVKPQPEAYEEMARRLDADASQCVMIDDQERNITGAREAGMQAILYENLDQLKTDLNKLLAADTKD